MLCVCSVEMHVYVYVGIGKTVYYYQRDVCLKVLYGGKQKSMRTDPVLLDFRHRVFNWLRDCGKPKPWSRKSVGSTFPAMLLQFVSLHCILVILAIFQTFHYYYMSVMVISSLCCNCCETCLRWTEPVQTLDLTHAVCCSLLLLDGRSLVSPPSCTSHSL